MSLSLSLSLSLSILVWSCLLITLIKCLKGHMSLHHSDQMSQWPKVSRIALSGCSLNVKNVFSYDTLLIKEGWNIKSIHQKPSTPPSISLLRGASEGALLMPLAILYLYSCLCLCNCLFVGQFMSPHHSDQRSQRSQVSF